MEWLFISILNFTGYNYLFWASVSAIRWLSESRQEARQRRGTARVAKPAIAPKEVAVVMAAHNEELSLSATLAALKKIVPSESIYVGSDSSTDRTVHIARQAGVNVDNLKPNRGKAKVLTHLFEKHNLTKRYRAIMLLDADVVVNEDFLKRALPFFNDFNTVAVAGHATSRWHDHWLPRWSLFFTAYRIRMWRILQYTVRYGQTWQHMNMTTIAPGGSSIYRSSVLEKIRIDTPGLIIEDFNMTFTIHHRKLGKIAYHPKVFVTDQEPYSLRDYWRQVYRWHLGWWQTVIRHGIWPSWFCFATLSYEVELLVYTLFTLTAPLLLGLYALNGFQPLVFTLPFHDQFALGSASLSFAEFLVSVVLFDFLVTAIVGFIEKKPMLSLYGIGFFFLRIVDAVTLLWTLPVALFKHSEGQWISPVRRA